ncbi:Similar to Transposon MAGGYgagandpolgenehomologues, related [Eimeria praecox]|uniref:Similar to Transposon MAGGYgagandpolgenehomologues, related n=1 Tax=Eimeria praecox TaxID=51316 RepID=U6GU32_9EIME|nr:Similar to Transposon MAGGYgagandpolgenehomologues, related [Eimeria praecox]
MPPAAGPELPAEGAAPTPSPLTLLQPGGDPLPARDPARGKPRDYRADAGTHPRQGRRPAAAAASPSPGAALSSPPAPLDQPPTTSRDETPLHRPSGEAALTPQRWEAAYPLCPLFREAFSTARHREGDEVPYDPQGRRYTFRFQSPYLHICVHALWRICVPTLPVILSHVLYRHHDHVTAGHGGQEKTFLALSRLYYWPGMQSYTNAYVESCVKCRASKALTQKPAGLLQPILILSRLWIHVSIDFTTDLPTTPRGHDSILVIVDSLSKMAPFIPKRKTATIANTVELLAGCLIRYHGFSDVLISDRDPRFQSTLWQRLCHRFHIKRAMSSAYHPQTDGQTEHVNRTLEQMLRTYRQTDESEWERLLPALELAYNTTSHSSTDRSPFEVMIGQNPLTAADLDTVGALAPTPTSPMTKMFRQLCDRTQSRIMKAKWQQKLYADTRRWDVTYKPGDLVWISSRHLPGLNQCSQLEPRFRGPFPMTERIGQLAYRVALPPTYASHNVFHVSLLVQDRLRDPQMTPKEAAIG